MSKIGKKPIIIPEGIEVNIDNDQIEIKGKTGALKIKALDYISVKKENDQIILKPIHIHKQARANWGTLASLIKNAIEGVKEGGGFIKVLKIEGIGFRASMEEENLVLNVGFTHPVKFTPPECIKISVEKNIIKVSGVDKALVGQTAAAIRKIRKPEPYKGKGISYKDEIIRRKAGKKVATTGTGTAG